MADLAAEAADLANTLPPNMNDLAVKVWPRVIREIDDLATAAADMGSLFAPQHALDLCRNLLTLYRLRSTRP